MIPVFDGHNDILLRLWLAGDSHGEGFVYGFKRGGGFKHGGGFKRGVAMHKTHIDWPRAQAGGLYGGFFAIFVPAPGKFLLSTKPIDQAHAATATDAMMGIIDNLHANHPAAFRRCLTADDVRAAMEAGVMAAIVHIEGAEAIAPGLDNLADLYARGLRSVGPVWSRPNVFGHGVPFAFPGTPDQFPGLSDHGKALVRACDALGIMIDCAHLNEAGFRDIAAITSRPLVATHSNSHRLCPSPRNLTDTQLAMIAESGGMVGVNFAAGFLREDGRKDTDTPIETIMRHIDYLMSRLGEGGVGLGSDFDGATIPAAIGDCSGLPNLTRAMAQHGFGRALIDRICRHNWIDQIEKQIG